MYLQLCLSEAPEVEPNILENHINEMKYLLIQYVL